MRDEEHSHDIDVLLREVFGDQERMTLLTERAELLEKALLQRRCSPTMTWDALGVEAFARWFSQMLATRREMLAAPQQAAPATDAVATVAELIDDVLVAHPDWTVRRIAAYLRISEAEVREVCPSRA